MAEVELENRISEGLEAFKERVGGIHSELEKAKESLQKFEKSGAARAYAEYRKAVEDQEDVEEFVRGELDNLHQAVAVQKHFANNLWWSSRRNWRP